MYPFNNFIYAFYFQTTVSDIHVHNNYAKLQTYCLCNISVMQYTIKKIGK